MQKIQLRELKGKYAYCKISDYNPELTKLLLEDKDKFVSYTQTQDEISLVCEVDFLNDVQQHCSEIAKVEMPFRGFRIIGNLEFSLIGIVAGIASVLAKSEISLCTISTFDTDYFFVKEDKLKMAKQSLELAGYLFNNS